MKGYSYHIHSSEEHKMYDLVIKQRGWFLSHYHVKSKEELINLINNKNYNYKKDRGKSYELQTD